MDTRLHCNHNSEYNHQTKRWSIKRYSPHDEKGYCPPSRPDVALQDNEYWSIGPEVSFAIQSVVALASALGDRVVFSNASSDINKDSVTLFDVLGAA